MKLGWAEEDVRCVADRLCTSGILGRNVCQGMTIFHRAKPAEAFLRELVSDHYGRIIQNYGIQRVVVDSLTQFERYPSASEQARVRFERVVNALRREGVSVMMTRETETREAPFRVTPDLPYPFLLYPRQSSFG